MSVSVRRILLSEWSTREFTLSGWKSARIGTRTASYVFAAIGIHPSDITKENNTIENLENLLTKSNKIVAIGEIGLDYHWENYPSKEVQIEWFIKQIKLANKYKLPIIIHSRDAMGDTVEVLKNTKIKTIYIYGKHNLNKKNIEYIEKISNSKVYIYTQPNLIPIKLLI